VIEPAHGATPRVYSHARIAARYVAPVAASRPAPVDPSREQAGEPGVEWRQMGEALRRNAMAIGLAVISVTLLVLALSLVAPAHYRATARIVGDASPAETAGAAADPRGLTTNLTLLNTPTVRAAAARRVPGETASSVADKVSAVVEPDANVIAITATTGTAASAAALANATAQAFLDQRAANARALLGRTSATLTDQLARLQQAPDSADQAAAVRRRLSDLMVDQANAGSDLQLAAPAQPPSGPSSPRPFRDALIACFIALAVAVLAVLVRERVRPAVGGPRDMRRVLGISVLARLPASAGPRTPQLERRMRALADRTPRLARVLTPLADLWAKARSRRQERSAAGADDMLHSLLGAVVVAVPPGPRRVIVVTSPGRDGASTCAAAALARGLAGAGERTLALSTDLAAPGLGQALGVPEGRGLSRVFEHLRAGAPGPLRTSIAPQLDRLQVIPDERHTGPGIELLRPGAVDGLFSALADADCDYVVVDAPAVTVAPETWLVARHADAILLACPERASAEELADARDAVDRLGVRVLGAVLVDGAGGGTQRARSGFATVAGPPSPEAAAPGPSNGRTADAESERLLELLRAADSPLTVAELCGTLDGASPTTVRARLRQLQACGQIVRRGTGGRRDPFVYGPPTD
jgi:Mrp family chromosome partitioning ATPase/capsular polysaccharide biosynthesis protein